MAELNTLGSVIKTAYENEDNTNAFTNTEKGKLATIEDNATADQTNSEILSAVETASGRDIAEDGAKLDSIMLDKSIYGVRWDYANDVMIPGIVIGDLFVESDYTIMPIQEEMKRGLLTTDGDFTELDPSDSTKLFDGTTATLDGSAGQVMVQIPRFNVLAFKDGEYRYCLISRNPFVFKDNASWVPPAFKDDDYRYIGAFQGVAATDALDADLISAVKDTSAYSTNPNPNPFSNRTRSQFRAQQESGFFQYSWGLYEIVWMLFLTEFKTWNSQEALPGYTEASSYNYTYARQAGRTLSLGNSSGSILADLTGDDADLSGIVGADEYIANSYRGIENVFGGLWQLLDGINIDNTIGDCKVYVCNDPENFNDGTATNYIDTGHAPGFGDDDGFIKDMAFLSKNCIFYPSEIGGGASSSTYIPDYTYNGAGGWRVLCVGGDQSRGEFGGLGYLNVYYAASDNLSTTSTRSAA